MEINEQCFVALKRDNEQSQKKAIELSEYACPEMKLKMILGRKAKLNRKKGNSSTEEIKELLSQLNLYVERKIQSDQEFQNDYKKLLEFPIGESGAQIIVA